jgi:phospholipase C
MTTRRDFLKKTAMLSGAGLSGVLPPSIRRAIAIDPQLNSSYLDAEHVVILMQENRSFDHCYGSLRGVRGFNDPRAITLPNKYPVWLQSNKAGETYAPFRLNMRETNATWMGSLPHSWTNQVDARNGGKYDRWLEAKRSGRKEYAGMPLTLGYYTREDLPFYYALADAFTVCDQNFCSSLTGTTPNRLYLWTGTIREAQNRQSTANVRNEDLDYDKLQRWSTFPERLEENNISWKIYQNEISVGVEFDNEEDAWLANFTDNPIEWFAQYNVKFLPAYIQNLTKKVARLTREIKEMEGKLGAGGATGEGTARLKKLLARTQNELRSAVEDQKNYTAEKYEQLSTREKKLHEKAFATNKNDPYYHQLTTLQYRDHQTPRELKVPRGDVLHQFREDVRTGALPTVSWLVAPENFSDHPGAPWYGAWYVSEVMDILTGNADVWANTIFILAYDENDGYFDHVPPFTPPHPDRPCTGATSKGVDASVEYVTLEQDLKRKPVADARESSIGLGYRVPLVVASPWSRGGQVCSQVFDHTSILQFLEKFLSHKTGRKIEEPNISAWRRTVCGDLTSIFKPYQGEKISLPNFLSKDPLIESIHKAKFKREPAGYRRLSQKMIDQVLRNPSSSLLPKQEKGGRPSCPLPYQLYADGNLSADQNGFEIKFRAGAEIFAERSAGSPFQVYAPGKYKRCEPQNGEASAFEEVRVWDYAVSAGDEISDLWRLADFENQRYHLRVYGPNGFFREYLGSATDPQVEIHCAYERAGQGKLSGKIELKIVNHDRSRPHTVEVADLSYKTGGQKRVVGAAGSASFLLDLQRSFGWYDFRVTIQGAGVFEKRYAGRVETGAASVSDPAMS